MADYDNFTPYPDDRARRLDRICASYKCSRERAHVYLDLRDEGYSPMQAALTAGISDPPDPDYQKPVRQIPVKIETEPVDDY